MNFFKKGEEIKQNGETEADGTTGSLLDKVTHLLRLHGLETSELIHQYHLEQANLPEGLLSGEFGLLTVRVHFVDTMLRIEIMNARNLKAKDSNGKCVRHGGF